MSGVNAELCNRLELKNKSILIPQSGTIKKLITFVPKSDVEIVKKALF